MLVYISLILFQPTGGVARTGGWTDYSVPYKVFDISCTGNEVNLLDCQYNNISSSACGSSDAINVFCQKCKLQHDLYSNPTSKMDNLLLFGGLYYNCSLICVYHCKKHSVKTIPEWLPQFHTTV